MVRDISAQRLAYNEAIRLRRISDVVPTMLLEFIMISPGSGAITGRAKNVEYLERYVRIRSDAKFVLTPDRIEGHAPWGTANESGTWVERWTEKDGPVELRGRYFALWTFSEAAWRQQALSLGPSDCKGGAYCAP